MCSTREVVYTFYYIEGEWWCLGGPRWGLNQWFKMRCNWLYICVWCVCVTLKIESREIVPFAPQLSSFFFCCCVTLVLLVSLAPGPRMNEKWGMHRSVACKSSTLYSHVARCHPVECGLSCILSVAVPLMSENAFVRCECELWELLSGASSGKPYLLVHLRGVSQWGGLCSEQKKRFASRRDNKVVASYHPIHSSPLAGFSTAANMPALGFRYRADIYA